MYCDVNVRLFSSKIYLHKAIIRRTVTHREVIFHMLKVASSMSVTTPFLSEKVHGMIDCSDIRTRLIAISCSPFITSPLSFFHDDDGFFSTDF